MTNKMCFVLNISFLVLYWIIFYCNSNQVFGCTSTTATHKRSGDDVTIQFQAITVNSTDPSLSVRNQILLNYDSPLLSVVYEDGVYRTLVHSNNCTVTGNASTGDLSIRLDNLQKSSGGTYKHLVRLDNLQKSSGGTYTHFTQGLPEIKECVVVFILGVPTKPVIRLDKIPLEGESAVLTCKSTSTTTPNDPNLRMTYNWKVNNRDANDQRYTYSSRKNKMTISNIDRNDVNLQFTCTATEDDRNAYTSVSSDLLRMNVYYPASLFSFGVKGHKGTSTVSLDENDEGIQFLCEVDSNSVSSVKILFKDEVKNESSDVNNVSFTFSSVSCLDSGDYTCERSNTIGQTSRRTIKLLVNCTPRPLFRIDQNISSKIHVQAMMSFTALAYPYPGSKGFSWQKENGANWTPVLANRNLLMTSTALQSNLTIINITKTDYGRYRLIVNNSIGTFIQHFNIAETIAETISDKGEGAKCDICDPNKSTIITGVSLGIVNAILVGVLVTILYRMKTNRKGLQSHEDNVRQEEYVNASQSNIVEDKTRTRQYSVRTDTDISIANDTDEGRKQYMDLSEHSRDDKSAYDELKK